MQLAPRHVIRPLRVFPSPTMTRPRFYAWECRLCGDHNGITVYLQPDGAAREARIHLTTKPHPIPTVCVGNQPTLAHWIVLNLHRASQGFLPWHRRLPGSHPVPTAVEMNQAIEWWNSWHSLTPPPALFVDQGRRQTIKDRCA